MALKVLLFAQQNLCRSVSICILNAHWYTRYTPPFASSITSYSADLLYLRGLFWFGFYFACVDIPTESLCVCSQSKVLAVWIIWFSFFSLLSWFFNRIANKRFSDSRPKSLLLFFGSFKTKEHSPSKTSHKTVVIEMNVRILWDVFDVLRFKCHRSTRPIIFINS